MNERRHTRDEEDEDDEEANGEQEHSLTTRINDHNYDDSQHVGIDRGLLLGEDYDT